MQTGKFLWGDNWWLEDDKAYFCPSGAAAIFCADMVEEKCELVATIPNCRFSKNRMNSYCIKYQNKIFCTPYEEKKICYYDIQKKMWENIEVDFKSRPMICLNKGMANNEKIWVMELRGEKIYQVNLASNVVEKEFEIFPKDNLFTGRYIIVQHNLYCTIKEGLCRIDMEDGSIKIYKLPDIKDELYTICYDGCNFWISGVSEIIYIWNPQSGIIKKITDFIEKADNFYLDSGIIVKNIPVFADSILLGKNIWFIPLQCNAPIMYMNKEDYNMRILNIEEEQETKEELIRRGSAFKYVIEYIRQDRFIGLYSVKNRKIFEIDTFNKSVQYKNFKFCNKSVLSLAHGIYADKKFLREREDDLEVFSVLFNNQIEEKKETVFDVGKLIYESVKLSI